MLAFLRKNKIMDKMVDLRRKNTSILQLMVKKMRKYRQVFLWLRSVFQAVTQWFRTTPHAGDPDEKTRKVSVFPKLGDRRFCMMTRIVTILRYEKGIPRSAPQGPGKGPGNSSGQNPATVARLVDKTPREIRGGMVDHRWKRQPNEDRGLCRRSRGSVVFWLD